jgi:hypothetical protein
MSYLHKKASRDTLENDLLGAFEETTLSTTTKLLYAKKLAHWISFSPKKTLYSIIEDPDTAMKALAATKDIKHTPTNHHLYISALVAYLTHIHPLDPPRLEKWKEIQKGNWKPISDHYERNEPTELQKEKMMDFKAIEEARDQLEVGSMERLLLTFYTKVEPLRADYYATEIVPEGEDSKEENYITLGPSGAKLIVNDFKTKRKYDRIENDLDEEVLDELIASLKMYPRDYLFATEGNKPYTRKLFSNWACRVLSRVLEHPMTLTVLRHMYITQKIKEKTPVGELVEIAKKMGHSRNMQRVYDWS